MLIQVRITVVDASLRPRSFRREYRSALQTTGVGSVM